MLTLSWRRVGSTTTLALLLLVGLPALAEAQLFPNLFIQRQRTECANEPPFYGHVRREYYGYYPTCWRKFPDGWACPCPNPEAPNRVAAFNERPRDDTKDLRPPDDDELMDPDTGAGAGGNAPKPKPRANDPSLPGVPPGGRSPFELDDNQPKRPAVPNTGPKVDDPFTTPAPKLKDTLPPVGASPFDAPPSTAPRASGAPAGAPALDIPAVSNKPKSASRTARTAETVVNNSPVLSLPEIAPPTGPTPDDAPTLSPLPASLPTNGAYLDNGSVASRSNNTNEVLSPASAPAPAQAPRRPSMLGSLFGGGNRTRR
jgi:hypothetical protein